MKPGSPLVASRSDLWATGHQNGLGDKANGHGVDRLTCPDHPSKLVAAVEVVHEVVSWLALARRPGVNGPATHTKA